jgi:hypothetical protein
VEEPAAPAARAEQAGQPIEDDWAPGVPPIGDLWPSIVGGAVVPLTVYYLVRQHVGSDATALIIAGIFPAAWVIVQFIRKRTIDPIGAVVLLGFATGVTASVLLGGNAYVLKVKDSAFTAVFGLGCLISIFVAKRPAMFYVGRFLSTGNEPDRVTAYNALHDLPGGEHTFKILTAVWGAGLMLEASSRLVLAAFIPTGIFLAVSPVITAVCVGGMFLFTIRYTNRARRLAAGPH